MQGWILDLVFFFFNDTATTEIYTLSLHDALPIWGVEKAPGLVDLTPRGEDARSQQRRVFAARPGRQGVQLDRKSTRLNSSHANISYAVFCLKKKTNSRLYMSLFPPCPLTPPANQH